MPFCVLSLIYLLMAGQYAELTGKTVAELPLVLMGIVMSNGTAEVIAAFIMTPRLLHLFYYRFLRKEDSMGRVKS